MRQSNSEALIGEEIESEAVKLLVKRHSQVGTMRSPIQMPSDRIADFNSMLSYSQEYASNASCVKT